MVFFIDLNKIEFIGNKKEKSALKKDMETLLKRGTIEIEKVSKSEEEIKKYMICKRSKYYPETSRIFPVKGYQIVNLKYSGDIREVHINPEEKGLSSYFVKLTLKDNKNLRKYNIYQKAK